MFSTYFGPAEHESGVCFSIFLHFPEMGPDPGKIRNMRENRKTDTGFVFYGSEIGRKHPETPSKIYFISLVRAVSRVTENLFLNVSSKNKSRAISWIFRFSA